MVRTFALAFALLAAAAVAAPSPTFSYLDFGKGPAQWIMTDAEQRAWRAVKTEDQAHDFVDLFWARRDPTPGTSRNEFRLDFESRVKYADEHFKEERRRGAMTERGRVLLALGYAGNVTDDAQKIPGIGGNDIGSAPLPVAPNGPTTAGQTGGRALDAREVWNYTHEQATKFDVPKIEVVFLHEPTGRVRRDPLRGDFLSALPGAIRSYIISPDMTTVPDWASSRHPKVVATAVEHAAVVAPPVVTSTVVRTVEPAAVPVARPAGAGKLTLLRDINALQPQSGADPFESLQSVASFRSGDDLGWTAEFCAGRILSDVPSLKVQLRLSGGPVSQPVSMVSEAEEFVPDSIKASPGCYLVRGSLPLTEVEPGSYKLTVTIAGTQEEQRYNLTRGFRIE